MYHGVLTPVVTPFSPAKGSGQPEIDFKSLDDLVEWQLECGIQGIVACGTSGESVTLSHEEKVAVTKRIVAVVKKRVPVLVGTGSYSTRETIEFTKLSKELGADGALVVSPYYNKPTQEGLYQHFVAVGKEGGLPVVLYDVPGRTCVEIAVETYVRLLQHPEIVGVKLCTDSVTKMMDLSAAVAGSVAWRKFDVMTGDCAATYLTMTLGGTGAISASANVIPAEMLAVTDAYAEGDFKKSCEAQWRILKIIKAMFAETNPVPVKTALAMMGKIKSDAVRLPLVAVKKETRELIGSVLELR